MVNRGIAGKLRASPSVLRVLGDLGWVALPSAVPGRQELRGRALAELQSAFQGVEQDRLVLARGIARADALQALARDLDQLARDLEHGAVRSLRAQAVAGDRRVQ